MIAPVPVLIGWGPGFLRLMGTYGGRGPVYGSPLRFRFSLSGFRFKFSPPAFPLKLSFRVFFFLRNFRKGRCTPKAKTAS